MREQIMQFVRAAARKAYEAGDLPSADIPEVQVEEPKLEAHGDFSTNLAMTMAATQKMAPRKIAEIIAEHLQDPEGIILKTDVAGPGFLNFYLAPEAWHPVLARIHSEDAAYGRSDVGKSERVQVEFVSANPTGPLHVGHGRGAAVGDAVAAILSACGYDVQREYYINDSGRQIRTLGRSVYLRLLELAGRPVTFPEDGYQGQYIRDLAQEIAADRRETILAMAEEDAVADCARYAAERILSGIRQDLEAFGVRFDRWYSEQTLYDSRRVETAIETFQRQGRIFEKDGALWFNTSEFGDEKDRVVVRNNGMTTYFASDIAYHQEKFERGFSRVIDVWGADHHGYIPRMSAAVEACGLKREQFQVILVQLVNLMRGGQPVAMSTRAGEFVTLKDVVDEVGKDAARFLFLTRHYESPLDFDLELAKKKSNDNPVYYVQYVHARICSIEKKARQRGADGAGWDPKAAARLTAAEEILLIKALARFPEVVKAAANLLEPHRIAYYLMDLASAFHAYYNKHRVLTDDPTLTRGRRCLVEAVRKVIRNGLDLMGVSAPEQM